MAELQNTAAEALTLQLAINETLAGDGPEIRLSDMRPFKSLSTFQPIQTAPVVVANLFTINVPASQCLVLTYVNAFMLNNVLNAAGATTFADFRVWSQISPNVSAFFGTRQNSVNNPITPAAGIAMYTNASILIPWGSNTGTVMNITPADAALWPDVGASSLIAYLRFSGFFVPSAYYNTLQKLQTNFVLNN